MDVGPSAAFRWDMRLCSLLSLDPPLLSSLILLRMDRVVIDCTGREEKRRSMCLLVQEMKSGKIPAVGNNDKASRQASISVSIASAKEHLQIPVIVDPTVVSLSICRALFPTSQADESSRFQTFSPFIHSPLLHHSQRRLEPPNHPQLAARPEVS